MHFMVIFRDGNIHLYRKMARAKTKTKPPLYKLLERTSERGKEVFAFQICGCSASDTLLPPLRTQGRSVMGAKSRNDATPEFPDFPVSHQDEETVKSI